jgi:hypothetical protein
MCKAYNVEKSDVPRRGKLKTEGEEDTSRSKFHLERGKSFDMVEVVPRPRTQFKSEERETTTAEAEPKVVTPTKSESAKRKRPLSATKPYKSGLERKMPSDSVVDLTGDDE